MLLGKLDFHMLKHETRQLTCTIKKLNSKWMKALNVGQDSIKILEENTGKTLFELGPSNFLQDSSMEARETKAKRTIGTS